MRGYNDTQNTASRVRRRTTTDERQRFVQTGADVFLQQTNDMMAVLLKEPVLARRSTMRFEMGYSPEASFMNAEDASSKVP